MKITKEVEQMRNRLNGVLPLAPVLRKVLQSNGVQAALKQYDVLKETAAGKYDFAELQLDRLGYELYDQGKFADAVELFKRSVQNFPDSWSAYDSLAEAYLAAGDLKNARFNYEQSLKINPDNKNARTKIQQELAGVK